MENLLFLGVPILKHIRVCKTLPKWSLSFLKVVHLKNFQSIFLGKKKKGFNQYESLSVMELKSNEMSM